MSQGVFCEFKLWYMFYHIQYHVVLDGVIRAHDCIHIHAQHTWKFLRYAKILLGDMWSHQSNKWGQWAWCMVMSVHTNGRVTIRLCLTECWLSLTTGFYLQHGTSEVKSMIKPWHGNYFHKFWLFVQVVNQSLVDSFHKGSPRFYLWGDCSMVLIAFMIMKWKLRNSINLLWWKLWIWQLVMELGPFQWNVRKHIMRKFWHTCFSLT